MKVKATVPSGGDTPMPIIDLPGVHLWYVDTGGHGVPVLFMHAASGTSESWAPQLPTFTAAGYRCITYDRRGWGRSRPDPTGEAPEGAAPTQWRQGLRPRASEGR